MEEYKPNSRKYKEEQKEKLAREKKKVDSVVHGKAVIKKKGGINKLTDVFISEDASNVKSYIFADVLVPALKKLVSDIVKDSVDMIFYGGVRRDGSRSNTRAGYVSYDRFSDRRDDRRPYDSSRNRTVYTYDDITFETKGDALEVLNRMDELLDDGKVVSVGDMYDLSNLPANYTDYRYGWTNLANADIVRTMDGRYKIRLPRAIIID